MWKDFFYFTKAEKIGFYILISLIGVAIIICYIISSSQSTSVADKAINEKIYQDYMNSIHQREKGWNNYDFYYTKKKQIILAPFDPNTADSITFIRLGLPPFMARNILHYRAKGGKFRTTESFAKVYGLSPQQFTLLKPYITIGSAFLKGADSLHRLTKVERDTLKYYKYPVGKVISLDQADTTELKKIPGIGSSTAKRIIAYRNQLGGFYKVSQLQEITHIGVETNKWFFIQKAPIHILNINRFSIERLTAHPYLNFYQAKVILEYRKKKGALKSLKELALYEEFTPKDFERLSPYVSF